ncbi:MAG: hypothetical protein ACWA5X_08845 [bacterium]
MAQPPHPPKSPLLAQLITGLSTQREDLGPLGDKLVLLLQQPIVKPTPTPPTKARKNVH